MMTQEGLLASLEVDGKGEPVLLRQYLKLGAKTLDFNVDASVGRSIDVLVAVSLDQLDERVLAQYMGSDGAAAFRAAGGRAVKKTACHETAGQHAKVSAIKRLIDIL